MYPKPVETPSRWLGEAFSAFFSHIPPGAMPEPGPTVKRTITVQIEYDPTVTDLNQVAEQVFRRLATAEVHEDADGCRWAWSILRTHAWNSDHTWIVKPG